MLPAVLFVSLAALARASPNPAATLTAVSPAPTVDVITRPITPCAVVKCTASTTCVVINGRASCRPIKPQQCGPTVCPAGTTCCNALCGICTPPGMMCVQGCKVTPDYPVLTLTPVVRKEEPPVSVEAKCGKNWCGQEEPEVVEPPKATILPVEVGQKCGRNVCGKGQFCCNSSCSQCAPLGGACTMQFCGHESVA